MASYDTVNHRHSLIILIKSTTNFEGLQWKLTCYKFLHVFHVLLQIEELLPCSIYGQIFLFEWLERNFSFLFMYNIFNFLIILLQIFNKNIPCLPNVWDKVYKTGPSKICGRQSLKSSKWSV